MPRPKRGTKAGDQASQKFRVTMIRRYGSYEAWIEHIKAMGAKGGSVCGIPKGFALMTPEKRRTAGAKGGSISRRNAALEHARRAGNVL